MQQSQILKDFFQERAQLDKYASGYPFITISRQAGAGGRTLAEAIVKRTDVYASSDAFRGWQVFDKKLCDIFAGDPEFHVSMNALMAEEYHGAVQEFLTELMGGPAEQFKLYKKIFGVVRSLCVLGKVIIVGRAGSCVAGGLPGAIRIRLVASKPSRVERMMKLLDIGKTEAEKIMEKQDRERAKLVKDFFSHDIDDPHLYDVTWNTDVVSIDKLADEAFQLIKRKQQQLARA